MPSSIFRVALATLLSASFFVCHASAAAIRRRSVPAGVPSFAVDYAPLVKLYSGDPFRPSDIGAQVANTQPRINLTAITGSSSSNSSTLDLNNLSQLNSVLGSDNGSNIYLTATDYIDLPGSIPEWIKGVTPDSSGATPGATGCAIIVNKHPDGKTVDVFYMYFYAYNYGGVVLGSNLDDHVGDWEHNMVRFVSGKPASVWFSQHANGQAFTYGALAKSGQRPYVYSANGSHANYATAGTHDHTLQILNLPDKEGLLEDYTDDAGPVWDPTINAYYYDFDATSNTFTAYGGTGSDSDSSSNSGNGTSVAAAPIDWLYFNGKWGDDRYATSDPRQKNFLGLGFEFKYDAGPTGPLDKHLNRTNVCPPNGYPCVVLPFRVA